MCLEEKKEQKYVTYGLKRPRFDKSGILRASNPRLLLFESQFILFVILRYSLFMVVITLGTMFYVMCFCIYYIIR